MSENRALTKLADVAEDFSEILAHWSEVVKRFATGRWAKVALAVVGFFVLVRLLARTTFGISLRILGALVALSLVWNVYAFARVNGDDCHKTGSVYSVVTFSCEHPKADGVGITEEEMRRNIAEGLDELVENGGYDPGEICLAIRRGYEKPGGSSYKPCKGYVPDAVASWFADRALRGR